MKLKKMLKQAAALAVVSMAGFGPAIAHTSYVKPNVFSTSRADMVTLEVSFTENFSNPEVGVTSQDWHFYLPDGSRAGYDNIVELKQVTVIEQSLEQEGTFRFSTGERLGRTGKRFRMPDGSFELAIGEDREERPVPDGATVVTSQTATVADVYVTRGAPTRTAVDTKIGRLRIEPVTHPNEIYLDEGFDFRLTFDGAPMPGQVMTLYRDGGTYADDKGASEIIAGDGVTTISFAEPGMYMLMTRHQDDAPEGAETDIRSYTTSITFEVTR